MKLKLTVLVILLCCVVVRAQEPEVVRTNTELVQTAITVLDKKGKFVEGLQREQFELTVDGKQRPVAFFERVASAVHANANWQSSANQPLPTPLRQQLPRREFLAAPSSFLSTIFTCRPIA
jgi:hypothetical protein